MTAPLTHRLSDLHEQYVRGEIAAKDIVRASLARATAADDLGALLCVSDEVQAHAEALDHKRARGEPLGKLAGVPVVVKDALCTRDMPTTAGSRALTQDGLSHATGWRPSYEATVVSRLRDADALIIGKANMDEFAMGSSTENSAFGVARNPWARDHAPGGSSGGSAAAVAARISPVSLGSDTGGSIRQPASLCGVVGVKPSYGRVSRYGLVAFASSLDQVGPLSGDVRGAARVLEVIAGHCPRDATSSPHAVGHYEQACDRSVKGLRIGIPDEYFEEGLEDAVRESVEQVVDALRAQGADLKRVSLPHTRYGIATYYVLATAEASSNLSRFDGVRYGLRREPKGGTLTDLYETSREAGFGPEVKRRIMLGTYALSSGYYDAYYRKAQQVRTLIRRDFEAAFSQVDALITPSTPTVGFRLGEKSDPLQMYLADIYTLPASLAGICGLSVPAGLSKAQDTTPALPIGVQLLAPAFAEETLFQIAHGWEQVSPVAGRFPELGPSA